MLYTFSLLFCLFIAIWYDILGQSKYKKTWYHILLFWFITISALQFQVGTDVPHYMKEYKLFDVDNFRFSLLKNEKTAIFRNTAWIILKNTNSPVKNLHTYIKRIHPGCRLSSPPSNKSENLKLSTSNSLYSFI